MPYVFGRYRRARDTVVVFDASRTRNEDFDEHVGNPQTSPQFADKKSVTKR